MSKRLYKYQIWNSNWYKKNISEAKEKWNEVVINGSEVGFDEEPELQERKLSVNDFFPWWRLER